MPGDVVKPPSTFKPYQVVGIVVLVVLALVAFGLASSSTKNQEPARTYVPPVVAPLVVHYEVEGDGASSASITVQTPTGTSQSTADLPLTNKSGTKGLIFNGFSRGDFLYISAQNQDEYGSITCRIKVGDTVVSENTSSGAYQIASCQGSA